MSFFGKVLSKVEAKTAEELAKQGGLDFTAIKKPLTYEYGHGKDALLHIVPDKVAVVREDDPSIYLGTVGINRGILQYMDSIRFTEELVEKGEASYLYAGTIGRGKQAFVIMKGGEHVTLGHGDLIEQYFYMTTSHDSSRALDIVPAFYRSTNQTVLTFPEKYRLRFKHGKHVEKNVSRAKASLARVMTVWEEFSEATKTMMKVKVSDTQAADYFKMLVEGDKTRAENIRGEMDNIRLTAPACQLPGTKGTLLGCYFAVIEYADKRKTVRKHKWLKNEEDANLHARLEGDGARQKAEGYGFALKLQKKFSKITSN